MDAKDLADMKTAIEKIGNAHHEFKKVCDERDAEIKKFGEARGETEQKLARLNERLDEVGEIKDRLDRMEAAIARGDTGSEESKHAEEVAEYKSRLFDHYCRRGEGKSDEKLEGMASEMAEFKAMRSNSDPDGGYWVTADTSGRMVQKIFETSPMRPLASVQSISTDALEGTTDYDEADAAWEENEQEAVATDSDTPTVGKWRIPVHGMATRPRATTKLLEDASIDVEAWLMNKVSAKFARFENTAFVNGDGAGKPRGFTTYDAGTDIAAKQVEQLTSNTSNVLTDDDFMDLIYGTKGEYRDRGTFAMNRLTIGATRKIKDNEGRYIWQPGLQAGEPSSLLGYPVAEMNDMDDVGTGNLPVAFADWAEFYQIVDRLGMSILRDPYSAKPYVEFYVRRRVGGAVLNFEAGKLLVIA